MAHRDDDEEQLVHDDSDEHESEEQLLRSVALQNANSILLARQRAEQELVAAKEALHESNQRVTDILESITDGFMVVDKSWRITYLNQQAEEILRPLQKSSRNLLLKNFWEEFPALLGMVAEQKYRRAMEQQVKEGFELYFPPLNSWLDIRAYPAKDGLSIYFQDVTLRKKAEIALRESEQFNRSIIENSRDYTTVLDIDGNLLWVGAVGPQQLFVGDVEQSLGNSWIDFWRSEDRAAALAGVQTAAQGGTGNFVASFAMEQRLVWLDVVVTPILNAEGQPQKLLAVAHDITERKLLLDSERAARADAERASHMKDEFLATLSHELRTPLSAILGWAHVLRLGARSECDLLAGLETIERNARAQTQLIEDLLDMSRITSGQVRLDIQSVEPVSFVEAALETIRPAAAARGIRLVTLLDPAAGPISGDPSRLQQVIWNLLSNAVKFTPKDGRVQIVLARVNSHIEIAVADTGAGIKAEFLPHVFERFRQADASTTRRYGGLGLGLSIVKHLVELHGGVVQVESAGDNLGTTFTVRLPLAAVHRNTAADSRAHPAASSSPAHFNALDLSGIKVLVVDDEVDARVLIQRVLADCGAEVSAAGNATEALELVEAQRPHVLVSDIGMPDVDGFELLKRIRALGGARGGQLSAIALTAFARSEDRTRALRAGFLVHVAKPVEPSELIATVATVAGRTGA